MTTIICKNLMVSTLFSSEFLPESFNTPHFVGAAGNLYVQNYSVPHSMYVGSGYLKNDPLKILTLIINVNVILEIQSFPSKCEMFQNLI